MKISPIPEVEKLGWHLFFSLYHYFQLESECLGGLFVNLFDALNPTVLLVSLYLPWSLHYQQKCCLLTVAENSENSQSNLKFVNAVWSKRYTVN